MLFRLVDAVFVGMLAAIDLPVAHGLLDVIRLGPQSWYTVDNIHDQDKTIDLVLDRKFLRGVDIATFLVSAHVQVFLVCLTICQTMNQPGITVKVEDDRVHGEFEIQAAIGVKYNPLQCDCHE
jgi:hypothetical protein